jgi:hypothetical protein
VLKSLESKGNPLTDADIDTMTQEAVVDTASGEVVTLALALSIDIESLPLHCSASFQALDALLLDVWLCSLTGALASRWIIGPL